MFSTLVLTLLMSVYLGQKQTPCVANVLTPPIKKTVTVNFFPVCKGNRNVGEFETWVWSEYLNLRGRKWQGQGIFNNEKIHSKNLRNYATGWDTKYTKWDKKRYNFFVSEPPCKGPFGIPNLSVTQSCCCWRFESPGNRLRRHIPSWNTYTFA